MKRLSDSPLVFSTVLALMLFASGAALAVDGLDCVPPVHSLIANGAAITPRVFNDCQSSSLSFFNGYPGQIWIRDALDFMTCGWANLHVWNFSEDGGLTPADFENCSHYTFSATVVLNPFDQGVPGFNGPAEAGIRVSPWWSGDVDGRFMVRAGAPYGNGEIACFGGRLPFYSFTTHYGITYVNDTAAYMEIVYDPHSLTEADPATITYNLGYQSNFYTSGPLAFDHAPPPAEEPVHGNWGELFPTHVGGFFQLPSGFGSYDWICTWSDIGYDWGGATPARNTSWSQIKALYR